MKPGDYVRSASSESLDPTFNQEFQTISKMGSYIRRTLLEDNFVEYFIPSEHAPARCNILATQGYSLKTKLIVFLGGQSTMPGIWSRSLLLQAGINTGSMMPYFRKAQQEDYGIVVMNPNLTTNTICDENDIPKKIPIMYSSTPEEHVQHVWEQYIYPSAAHKIYIISFGYGGVLAVNLIEGNMVDMRHRLACVAFIESSHRLTESTNVLLKQVLFHRAILWEFHPTLPFGAEIPDKMSTAGCGCISVGIRSASNHHPANAAMLALRPIFDFFKESNAYEYIQRLQKSRAELNGAILSEQNAPRVTIHDFRLVKVIGKGGCGKVFLVKKKGRNKESERFYAIKVIKKSAITGTKQIEQTHTERYILKDIKHPFIVHLRFAFQDSQNLYLVMDYFSGGTLFYHLREKQKFKECVVRFYAAQLVLALSHLHNNSIVYRDLKLENVLLDSVGNVALADFGLSHRGVAPNETPLSSFCGTQEYIAPELIQQSQYGKAVDWWALGIIIYELITGATPFYSANQEQNFRNILTQKLTFNALFSEELKDLLRGLLDRDQVKRLGTSNCQEIMEHPFFAKVDWEAVYRKAVKPPFKPKVGKFSMLERVFYPPKEVDICEVLDRPTRMNQDTSNLRGFTYTESNAIAST